MSDSTQKQYGKRGFKPYEGRKEVDHYVRLTYDMLLDEAYMSLSNEAKVLYSYMKMWAYNSPEFVFFGTFDCSISVVMRLCRVSNKTAINIMHELEQKNFIVRKNNPKKSKQTSKWAFSSKWGDEQNRQPSENHSEKKNTSGIGYVYLVKLDKHYKIGISKQPSIRLKEFTLLPYPLEEICVVKVNEYRNAEEELHKIFENKRVRGEWFELNEADVSFIRYYLQEIAVD